MNQLRMSRDKHLIELVGIIRNKGLARQYILHFRFNILTFDDIMQFDLSDVSIEKRLKFNKLGTGLRWASSEHPAFVDGGINNNSHT